MFVYIIQENNLFINILNKCILSSNHYITISKLGDFISSYILGNEYGTWDG